MKTPIHFPTDGYFIMADEQQITVVMLGDKPETMVMDRSVFDVRLSHDGSVTFESHGGVPFDEPHSWSSRATVRERDVPADTYRVPFDPIDYGYGYDYTY